ncbi:peptide-methionine (S)-S-oxide reductase [Rhodovulum sulfidophilum]|uniref:Peptide methionine sulfoxide reductase MsrA n=1 Tax=Rhodovulum visakhapatnamense TaxID=364297 RepID=A0ABS1RCV5_9RHOB|nr:peptide-methionine (S)-S-oxide reductase MsrA [Rhodovulum visakhapatnamense]MBL3568276.1 peptide-methionine (S)-S-oxide reductase MsrA [Rhodovulum visakhapatnamense]MBL3576586.1 peptide-methionine (S)-S-oxide reductase MsrA [Rhodovulum visakhapatnamense]OLS43225.1 peptide-methionine (S)-S-oxide reductase [Rhodovulum sulfidophilum]
MGTSFGTIRTALLIAAIALGHIAQGQKAHAAEPETAIFAGGCFWCVEADFEKVRGVSDVVSGYTGGHVDHPAYRQVARGGTGHVEAVKITYDPDVVSYGRLVELFFRSVDPTDAGGQFCDRGETYRTAIFVSDPAERRVAEAEKGKAGRALGSGIATEILPAATFWKAEAYHQDYYKSRDLILTRFGPKTKAEAYKLYRAGCGRDERVRALWGDAAPFAGAS